MQTLALITLLAVSLFSTTLHAAESVQILGYTVGQSTLEEVKASLRERGGAPRDHGISTHSRGPMLVAGSPEDLGVEGLRGALLIFDTDNRLTAGQLTLGKHRYDAIVAVLKGKYPLVGEQRPHVGNRRADFRAGDHLISVEAPHMSFEMTVSYRSTGFQKSMDEAIRREAEQKRQRDRDQF